MTKTENPHSPTNLVTEDYEFVTCAVNHLEDAPGWVIQLGDYGLELSRWIARTDHLGRGTHQCHHCGAHLNYFAILRHVPTGDAVVVGETCLDNRFELATEEFQALRKAGKLDRERARIREEVEQFVAENPDLEFLALKDYPHTNEFVADVAHKLRTYGSLSDRQIEAVRRAVKRDAEYAEKKKAEDDAKAAGLVAPVPTGRVEIVGEVLSIKVQEGYYGTTVKLLVKGDEGWKVWGTRPSALADVERGDRVRFTAAVEQSKDDEYFGFYKRPTKAEKVEV